ncbi:energy-coupling factor transporter transmembrane component T family protein [Desulforamulus aeronauticus]|uniref:Energy-coupling factor transport system permease protein n=1 Tax=Desulforamulus aeronauticus DSM 10349 TaxID=1121421 RepID=A0A1M6QIX3_9FIRM|nr:energy-coupling factor transporter transmembrane protein EcfT [Desulforamulus aeronauticus]SHK19967.1 energy-coupling factor transport system permease protein [Desulforamulus aeronauticus DSM 10349]
MSFFSNITVGQYYPGNSLVHRLDPRAKLLAMPLIMAGVLLAQGPVGYLAAGLPILFGYAMAKVPLAALWRGMRFLWIFLIISLILQAVTYPGETLWEWGIISVSREGLLLGLRLIYRLVLLVLAAMLLTMTTTPVNLTGAMEKLLQPLKRLGVPVHELAMMMTIALRFVPTLLEEAEVVMKAQQARGGSLTTGSLEKRLGAAVALLVPLLAGSLRRADELAIAMEARCYRGDNGRTRLKQFQYRYLDFLILLILFASTILVGLERWV